MQDPAQGGGGAQPAAGLSGADVPGGNSSSSVSGNVQGGGNYAGAVFADYAVAQAQYPESLPEPKSAMFIDASGELDGEAFHAAVEAYRAERTGRINGSESYRSRLYPFYGTTMRELLVSDEHVNRAYSPLNLYIALSMLSELTGGESRAQLLTLLDAHDIEAVRESASALWLANYSDSSLVTSTLANSLWLRQDVDFVPETMQGLADIYQASSFRGDMESEEFLRAFQAWLNEQTGGLLKEQAGALKLDGNTVLELASTIYFRAQWQDRFYEENTAEGTFHAASGDITCDFMHRSGIQSYYRGDNFSAVCCDLALSGGMWLFLPDEDASVNEVIESGEALRLLRESSAWENRRTVQVDLSLPKFDIVSDLDLIEALKAMGVTDIFDERLADFSPMAENRDGVTVGEARHAARVLVDEEGCTAAAYTVLAMNDSAAIMQERADFVLDRPFLFAVTGADGSILFLGVVEEPQQIE